MKIKEPNKGSRLTRRIDGEMSGPQSPARLITAMCIAEVMSMAGVFAFPALLPEFFKAWGLSHTQGGWINGLFFGGYTVAVPVLASLTDRVDARRIYAVSAVLGTGASLGFALFASGFWTALLFRVLGGMGMAGTFIPGLKALVDRLDGKTQARAISFYTATFSLGTSLSFFAAGELGARFGWRTAFTFASFLTLIAGSVAFTALRPRIPQSNGAPATHLLDFRPVLRNRKAMVYIFAYAAHMWELFAVRSWTVAFLAFCLGLQSSPEGLWRPATIASLTALVSMWASIGGAELALRFGRPRVLKVIMGASALFACGIGFTASLPYAVVAILFLVYCAFVQGDSAALHTGTVQSAHPDLRGATMAVQSLIGFGSASLGPLTVGLVLDLTGGGNTIASWGVAFITMGVVVGLGPFILGRQDRSNR